MLVSMARNADGNSSRVLLLKTSLPQRLEALAGEPRIPQRSDTLVAQHAKDFRPISRPMQSGIDGTAAHRRKKRRVGAREPVEPRAGKAGIAVAIPRTVGVPAAPSELRDKGGKIRAGAVCVVPHVLQQVLVRLLVCVGRAWQDVG